MQAQTVLLRLQALVLETAKVTAESSMIVFSIPYYSKRITQTKRVRKKFLKAATHNGLSLDQDS